MSCSARGTGPRYQARLLAGLAQNPILHTKSYFTHQLGRLLAGLTQLSGVSTLYTHPQHPQILNPERPETFFTRLFLFYTPISTPISRSRIPESSLGDSIPTLRTVAEPEPPLRSQRVIADRFVTDLGRE
jgi:hypothetical protein